jgi:hypothetical protein
MAAATTASTAVLNVTTEWMNTTTDERAARLAALQERRQTAPVNVRRRHAATGGRVLAAGLSVSASMVLMNFMAASRPATAAAVPAAPTPPASPAVIIVRRPATSLAATPAPAPPSVVNLAPVTRTHGS